VGLEDVSKYPDLFDRLAENRPGEPTWTNEDLEKLAGLNLIRVLEEVEKVSSLLTGYLVSLFLFYSWWGEITSLGIAVSNEITSLGIAVSNEITSLGIAVSNETNADTPDCR
jgi:hypothetical protein